MFGRKASCHEVAGIHADSPAEHLLIEQFRYWMSGHATHQVSYWNKAWDALRGGVDPNAAKMIFVEFHVLTRILHDRGTRQIKWLTDLGRCISRDEGLVLSLVQASQGKEPFMEIAAASELLGTYEVEALINASRSLAKVLVMKNLVLEPIEAVVRLDATDFSVAGRVLH